MNEKSIKLSEGSVNYLEYGIRDIIPDHEANVFCYLTKEKDKKKAVFLARRIFLRMCELIMLDIINDAIYFVTPNNNPFTFFQYKTQITDYSKHNFPYVGMFPSNNATQERSIGPMGFFLSYDLVNKIRIKYLKL
jgi:hypothetical protein